MDIEKKIRFVVNNVEEHIVQERISQYLERTDYRLVDREKMLYLRDTSRLGGMPAAFPKNLKVQVEVQTSQLNDQEVEVKARLSIEAPGQWLGKNEYIFWESELEGIKSAASAGSSYIADISKNERIAAAASQRSRFLAFLFSYTPLMLALLASQFLAHSLETKLIILGVGIFISLITGVVGTQRWMKAERTRRGKSESTYRKNT